MHRRFARAGLLLPLALAIAGCQVVKTENPLSPTIAGPISGVNITAPTPVAPSGGTQVAVTAQPIKLVVANAATSGVRPLSYRFEIASDAGFGTVVFAQGAVTPSDSGQTSLVLTSSLSAERTYYWRAKAEDGANASDYSDALSFRVYTPVAIGAPGLRSPADGATVTTLTPTLEVDNAAVSGPAGAISYNFAVSLSSSMTNLIRNPDVRAGSGRTSYAISDPLAGGVQYFWRVRAFDAGHVGPWSSVRSFTTPAAAKPPAAPNQPGGGSSSPAPNDQLDLRTVTIARGEDVSNWAVTATMTSAYRAGSDLCTEHTKAGQWPRLKWFDSDSQVEGNQWMFALIGGKWYGGAGEWMRPGQQCKNLDGHVGQGAFGGTAMEHWTPHPGETIGVMVTTPARAGQWGTAERSNVVLIKW